MFIGRYTPRGLFVLFDFPLDLADFQLADLQITVQ